jgi:large subunit ribosomal protein L19
MANTLQKFEARQVEKLTGKKEIPAFSAGDTLKVNIKIKEGERERIQAYEGVCIARFGSANNINASFTVRKISLGEGVERVFPLFSPSIESIELIRRGDVRRAKLYYLRDRRGKSARIMERSTGHGLDTEVIDEATANMTKTQKKAQKQETRGESRFPRRSPQRPRSQGESQSRRESRRKSSRRRSGRSQSRVIKNTRESMKARPLRAAFFHGEQTKNAACKKPRLLLLAKSLLIFLCLLCRRCHRRYC